MNETTAFAVGHWIQQVYRLVEEGRCNSPTFLRPHHFVSLAMALGTRGTADLVLPPALQRYAARMHLWEAIGLESPVSVHANDPAGRFVPMVRIEDRGHIAETASQLAAITTTYGADEQTGDAVRTSMMEILENCFAHAEVDAQLKGVACAQSWPSAGLVQIAIADAGVGVRRSLAGNPALLPRLESENSCALASEFGVTSKPGMGHAGYGLALTRQLLERAGGRLILVSGQESFQAHGNRAQGGQIPVGWQGTLAVLEWRTGSPLRLKDVYDSWPLPEGFNDDDFNFD